MDQQDDLRPLGDRIRALIEPALASENKETVQLKMLNEIFENLAQTLGSKRMEARLTDIFNTSAAVPKAHREDFIVEMLTAPPSDGPGGGYPTLLKYGLGLNPLHTAFSIDDVVTLPGYVALHQVAREKNVAIYFTNLLRDDVEQHGDFPQQPILIVNLLKPYAQGALEYYAQYPDLPPLPKPKPPRQLQPPKRSGTDLDI